MRVLLLCGLSVLVTGCGARGPRLPEKAPRPITAISLSKTVPESSYRVSGVVKSWKTEQIGFEVSGRVLWVLEPGREAEGRIYAVNEDSENTDAIASADAGNADSESLPSNIRLTLDLAGGNDATTTEAAESIEASEQRLISPGVPIAQIDPARYKVAVESAKAALKVAKLNQQVAEIQYQQSVPADIKSAEADLKLAQSEYDRMKDLRAKDAISKSELENAENRLQTQTLRMANLTAGLNQASAELASAKAQVTSAEQSLIDANRNLANTTLYSSYNGQISEVHVVPGSVVQEGSPVVTLQMMDPIKIELEVSAEVSREVQRHRQIPVTYQVPGGGVETRNGYVYLIDPSADAATRTFTVTLLLLNEKYLPELPESVSSESIARTADIWPVDLGSIVGVESDQPLFETKSILSDEQGSFVYVVDNGRLGGTLEDVIEVRKSYVSELGPKVPFLGNWYFQAASFVDANDQRDFKELLVAGELSVDENQNWDNKSVVFDVGQQWLLRPGDLVSLDLGKASARVGWHVPVDAIYESNGETFVFVIADGKAMQTKVEAILPTTDLDKGAEVEIMPIGSTDFPAGTQLVFGGVHFLKDGDAVRVIEIIQRGESSAAAALSKQEAPVDLGVSGGASSASAEEAN